MEITVHQSLCGERNKAWDLLKTSLPLHSEAKNLAFKCGLQEQPPSGISWDPFIRAFTEGDYFLLMRLFPDMSSDVRPGRAFSHVLIISKKDIASLTNLSQLIEILPSKVDKLYDPTPIKLVMKRNKFEISESIRPRFNKVIKGFRDLESYANAVVWIGQDQYEDAICSFWKMLTDKDKELVNFGVYFNSSQFPADKINFIATPESLENKFLNRQYCVVRKNDSTVLTEFPDLILAGDTSAEKRINEFRKAIEAEAFSRLDIEKIGKVMNTFENLDSVTDFKKLVTLSHVIAEYSPSAKKGQHLKSILVQKIRTRVQMLDESEIRLLRTFRTPSFQDSSKILVPSIQHWVEHFLLSLKVNSEKSLTTTVRNFFEIDTPDWLSSIVTKSIKEFFKKLSLNAGRLIYVWLRKDPDILQLIQTAIENSSDAEDILVETFQDNTDTVSGSKILKLASKRHWYKLHAIVLRATMPFNEAMSSQLKVDKTTTEGIDLIIANSNPKQVVEFTLSNPDSRLIKICGIYCKNNPSLLSALDVTNIQWQKIWVNAIKQGNSISDGISHPNQHIHKFYDSIVTGAQIDPNLLEELSNSDFANVLSFEKREKLWPRLPHKIKEKFLERTSGALLKALSEDPTFKVPGDAELNQYIFNGGAISTFLYYNNAKLKNVLPIFRAYSKLPEHILERYIKNLQGRFDFVVSEDLGRLVLERKYEEVAKVIYDRSKSDTDFIPALEVCYSLLSIVKQIKLTISGKFNSVYVPKNKWWDALTELVIELLPQGPMDQGIWKHSGGSNSKLLNRSTGEEGWQHAIKLIKQGKKGAPEIEDFLRELKREFGKVSRVKIIIDYWYKY